MLVALWGFGRVWRDPVWKDWRPIAVAAVALFLLSSKRFDWWGGWCFGYRLLVDAVTLLAFLAIPVAERIRERRVLHLAFVGLFLWSAGVQALGAYAYDVTGWNGRYVYDVVLPGTNNKATYDDSAQAQRRAGEGVICKGLSKSQGQMEETAEKARGIGAKRRTEVSRPRAVKRWTC